MTNLSTKTTLKQLLTPIIFAEQIKFFQIKINSGSRILKSGLVYNLNDLEFVVQSETFENEKYKVFFDAEKNNLACTCKDFEKQKENWENYACKHCFAVMDSQELII